MRFALFFALIVSILVGCSHAPTHTAGGYVTNLPQRPGAVPLVVPVYFDLSFTDSELLDLTAAFEEWNYALNGAQVFRQEAFFDGAGGQKAVRALMARSLEGMIVIRRPTGDAGLEDVSPSALAWVDSVCGDELNVAADRIGGRDLKTVVMHEIGHSMCIPHIPVIHTLMFPGYTGATGCIDRVTVQVLSTLRPHTFDWHTMNYCERPL